MYVVILDMVIIVNWEIWYSFSLNFLRESYNERMFWIVNYCYLFFVLLMEYKHMAFGTEKYENEPFSGSVGSFFEKNERQK